MSKQIACSLALAVSLSALAGGCASTTNKPPSQQGVLDQVGAGIKSASASVAGMFSPKKTTAPADVPTSNAKAGPNVFVAVAQARESEGNLDEAEEQYQKALKMDPNHLNALLGYAHLQDRRHNLDGALKQYKQALKKHSKEAAVHNDLGLCYHQHKMLSDAAKELQRTVELNGDRKLYRNNLAAVYVDQGKNKDALQQLTIAHGEAVANYNLAYLLMKKEDNATALVHFRKAAETDPSLLAAQQWIDKLSGPAAPVDPKSTQLAIVDQPAQKEPVLTAQRNSMARFSVNSIAAVPGNTQVVLRAGGQEDQPQATTPTAKIEAQAPPQPEKTEERVAVARRPNSLRDSSPASDSSNRLPSVAPSSN